VDGGHSNLDVSGNRRRIGGVHEGSARVRFSPQAAGRSSIGVRINRAYYFKGAIHLARFTRRRLALMSS
jgi:hypothetical protein